MAAVIIQQVNCRLLFTCIIMACIVERQANASETTVFSIKPITQYVWSNQAVTFECGTNISGYSLSFSIPAGIIYVTSVMDLLPEDRLATITFIATAATNGTSIRCSADDGNVLHFTEAAYVYVQGSEAD